MGLSLCPAFGPWTAVFKTEEPLSLSLDSSLLWVEAGFGSGGPQPFPVLLAVAAMPFVTCKTRSNSNGSEVPKTPAWTLSRVDWKSGDPGEEGLDTTDLESFETTSLTF